MVEARRARTAACTQTANAMSYNQIQPDLVFDANEGNKIQADDLTFQDFSGNTATSGRLGDPHQGLYSPDVEMQRQVGSSSGMLSLEYYTKYFDVDTKLVLERSWRTMYPRDDYVDDVLNGTPDLYGPFWLPTTLVLALFLSSSLSSSIAAYLSGQAYSYDFTRLSVALSIIYVYAFGIPAALWAVMRYWAGVDSRSLVDIVSLYGYGLGIWIPVAFLTIPPIAIMRLAFTALAYGLSGFFLLKNIYPLLSAAPSKAARILVVAVVITHTALAIALWIGFFSTSGGPSKLGPSIPSAFPFPSGGVADGSGDDI